MNIKFYLDKPNSVLPSALYLIYRQGAGGRDQIKYRTGIQLKPTQWDPVMQQVKKGVPGGSEHNVFLNTLKTDLQKCVSRMLAENEQVTFQDIRRNLEAILEGKKPVDTQKTFWKAYEEFLIIKTSQQRPNTIKKYTSTKNHLQNFEKLKRFPLSFERMDQAFQEHFTAYLVKDVKHTVNTVNKYITALKSFLTWSSERGYHQKVNYLKFKAPTRKAEIVVLTEKEVVSLMKLNLKKHKTLAKVRDTFLFGCFTGQRYSDIANLKREHIKGKTWHVHTVKTSESLEIPLIGQALHILDKYKEADLPLPVMTNQRTNKYLKDLCEMAKINELITITHYRGSERIDTPQPKHDLITTHTARRTFVTLSLEKGMRPEMVMEVTGHKDYATFRKYIKITSKVKDTEMRNVWKIGKY